MLPPAGRCIGRAPTGVAGHSAGLILLDGQRLQLLTKRLVAVRASRKVRNEADVLVRLVRLVPGL